MHAISKKCAIAGIGQTEFSKNSGRSELALALEAITKAIDDAGLSRKDIDGVMKFGVDASAEQCSTIAINLGTSLTFWGTSGLGGEVACGSVAHAAAAIVAGLANCVVCYRSMNGYSGARFGTGLAEDAAGLLSDKGWDPQHQAFGLPYGLGSPAQWYAMLAKRHMYEYGTTRRQFGAIAVAFRKHANRNPNAMMYARPLTIEDYEKGRIVAEPLCLYDCALETDGACAVVVTSAERARDLRHPPAYILAATQACGNTMVEGLTYVDRPRMTDSGGRLVAHRLYQMSGITPKDIDVAEVYDCFTITALMQLEDYGFCKRGEGGAFVEGGRIEPGGELPTNTAGGHLSEGYAQGMNHVLEGVRQIRGTSTSQVEGAEIALVSSVLPMATSGLILSK